MTTFDMAQICRLRVAVLRVLGSIVPGVRLEELVYLTVGATQKPCFHFRGQTVQIPFADWGSLHRETYERNINALTLMAKSFTKTLLSRTDST